MWDRIFYSNSFFNVTKNQEVVIYYVKNKKAHKISLKVELTVFIILFLYLFSHFLFPTIQ